MSDLTPDIKIENEESQRNTVNIGGIPRSTQDITPIYEKQKISFKDDNSDTSSKTESIKSINKNSFDYGMYADPKRMKKQEEDEEDESEESEDYSESEEESEANFSQSSIKKEPKKPALSRLELKIKKKDMLLKLHEAEQNGYQLTGKYNMNSELEEMEAEFGLYEQKMEQSTMIDFMQDGLMFIIKGIEVLNGIYNPMNLKLNGLSDKVYDRKEKLEHVFRRLAIKYSGGTEMPPELSLLFILGGAMIMTHMSNTALQGGGIPGLGNILGGNGNIMESISKIMGNMGNTPVPQNSPSPNDQMKPTQLRYFQPPQFYEKHIICKNNQTSRRERHPPI